MVKGKDKHSEKLVFLPSWLETCEWLVHSPFQMGGFASVALCMITRLILEHRKGQKRPFVTTPFQKLEKASGKDGALERHQKMQYHQRALDAGVALIQSA